MNNWYLIHGIYLSISVVSRTEVLRVAELLTITIVSFVLYCDDVHPLEFHDTDGCLLEPLEEFPRGSFVVDSGFSRHCDLVPLPPTVVTSSS